MKIAIASGKGGTGKTTVATNLAHVAARNGQSVAYLDCDVEEPNGRIFLKPEITHREPVSILVPQIDEAKCTLCGKCAEICQYNAIAFLGKKVLVFPELCHSCGGCSLVCSDGAITEVPREVGLLETGRAGPIWFVQGTLNIGEAKSPPVIRAVKAAAPEVNLAIIDAPPGTSCPVIESLRGCNSVVLVTEPTPFGLNDLKLAVEMVRALEVPFAVVINCAGIGDLAVQEYCSREGIKVLAEIRDDRRIAEAYSRGELVCEALPEYAALFDNLLKAAGAEAILLAGR
ncbi:MAG: ATP-binding protein [Planctomycetes bacterium]|nr:ATP-binding protein [Planctomycetota bacterium]